MSESPDKNITYQYSFRFEDGREKVFEVRLDNKTMDMVPAPSSSHPPWTVLSCCQCPHCPLREKESPYCPIAVNLVELVDFFKNSISYEEIDVQIETEERQYTRQTTMQKGVSSLLGIFMVTSSCPVMDKLRPMVRFHLPFATIEETTYRAISMYLMAQFFRFRQGKEPDWELKNLVDIYKEVQMVNTSFQKRLSQIASQDANANALVILDTFASTILLSINEDQLDDFEVLFQAYLT